MANTYFPNQFQFTKERMVCELYALVNIGAAGAPTVSRALGISSVVRNSAGNYTITLSNNYNRLLAVRVQNLSGASPQAAPFVTVVSQAVSAATPTMVLQYRAVDNSTATDPGPGEQIIFAVTLSNSSV